MYKTMWFFLFTAGILLLDAAADSGNHPLYDYVAKPDDNYEWKLLHSYQTGTVTVYVLNMTSLGWIDENFSSQYLWWHYVSVLVPNDIKIRDKVLFMVEGGFNYDSPPDDSNPFIQFLRDISQEIGTVTAMVTNVPNQPITFREDPKQEKLIEDYLIARTWKQYLDSAESDKNPEMLLLFPMVKGVVRAMDTVTEFCTKLDDTLTAEQFVVTGISKRGWTSWLTAAVDDRVIGLVPIVLTSLNLLENFKNHQRSLNGWSFAVKPYHDEGEMGRIDSTEANVLHNLIDPYEFRDRFTMPKLIIKATGDEFFLADDTKFWINEMPGYTNLQVLENAEHTLIGFSSRVTQNMQNFYLGIHKEFEFPEWTYELHKNSDSGSIDISVKDPNRLLDIKVWHADTNPWFPGRRDFRAIALRKVTFLGFELGSIYLPGGVFWKSDDKSLKQVNNGEYTVEYDNPKGAGWRAFFVTLTFLGPEGRPLDFSTEVNIIPDTYPTELCHGEECQSVLV